MKKKIYITALVVLIIDQLTKWLIINFMDLGESIKVIYHTLYITYINNDGAAWGIFDGQLLFLIIAAMLAIFYLNKLIKSTNQLTMFHVIAYGLLLGGIIGNLIDRIIYGHVIDFINIYIFNYDFPVFNVSDIAIVIGMILNIYDILKKGK
jgi:signal peptidase II